MRRLAAACVITLGAVVACSNETDGEQGPCARRSGSYVVRYKARSGTCGDSAETVLNITDQPTAPTPPCTGKIEYSTDNCEVTYDSLCPSDAVVKGGQLAIAGHSRWSVNANSGTAVEVWAIADGAGKVLCQATYDVTLSRP